MLVLGRRFAVASLLALMVAPAAAAQQQAGSSADMREISAYRLSMAGLGKLEKAVQKLEALPAEALAEATADDGADSNGQTLTEMAATIDRHPLIANALKGAGMSSREYSVATMALLQAATWAEMKKQGMASQIPADVSAANITFVEQHGAEIKALIDRMKKLSGDQ